MALSPESSRAADAALAALVAHTERIESAAADTRAWYNEAWASVVGNDSAAASVRHAAGTARTFLETMRTKRARLATDDEARRFVLAANAESGASIAIETARVASASGGAATVAKESAKDAGRALVETGQRALTLVRWGPYLVAGLVAAVVLLRLGGRRAS